MDLSKSHLDDKGRSRDTPLESLVGITSQNPSPPGSILRQMTLPLVVFAALLLAYNAFGHANSPSSHGNTPSSKKPNFVFIITDDQDLHLDSLHYEPFVQKHLLDKGTWFQKHFCTVSLCCPSRVSLLTGKAAHNTNVTDVSPPYGGYPKFVSEGLNDNYLPVWLQAAGYDTYYTGKLMNYHSTATYNKPSAAGWTRSDFLIDPGTYRYLDAIMTLNEQPYRSIAGNYSTDFVADRALEFLSNALDAKKPFFLGVAPVGPHAEVVNGVFEAPIPAERHQHLFPHVKAPRTPSFNHKSPGAVHYLKSLPPLSSSQIKYSDDYYRRRLQALQAVDELVDGIVRSLEEHPDVLANTFIIYTSDNGYHIGQHRLPPGKTCNIEEDINVPFIVRGPGVVPGKQVSFPTSHTDIVPTLFELAGIPLREDFDGIPIALTHKSQDTAKVKHEHINIEFWGKGIAEGTDFGNLAGKFANNTYKTVRVVADDYDFMYAVWCTNEHQLFDMKTDPYQLHNLHGGGAFLKPAGFPIPALASRLDALLLTLKDCKGKVCRQPWQTLFPNGDVTNLRQAMHHAYDEFFFEQQPNVTFSRCANGYITAYEGALKPLAFGEDVTRQAFEARWEDWV